MIFTLLQIVMFFLSFLIFDFYHLTIKKVIVHIRFHNQVRFPVVKSSLKC